MKSLDMLVAGECEKVLKQVKMFGNVPDWDSKIEIVRYKGMDKYRVVCDMQKPKNELTDHITSEIKRQLSTNFVKSGKSGDQPALS